MEAADVLKTLLHYDFRALKLIFESLNQSELRDLAARRQTASPFDEFCRDQEASVLFSLFFTTTTLHLQSRIPVIAKGLVCSKSAEGGGCAEAGVHRFVNDIVCSLIRLRIFHDLETPRRSGAAAGRNARPGGGQALEERPGVGGEGDLTPVVHIMILP